MSSREKEIVEQSDTDVTVAETGEQDHVDEIYDRAIAAARQHDERRKVIHAGIAAATKEDRALWEDELDSYEELNQSLRSELDELSRNIKLTHDAVKRARSDAKVSSQVEGPQQLRTAVIDFRENKVGTAYGCLESCWRPQRVNVIGLDSDKSNQQYINEVMAEIASSRNKRSVKLTGIVKRSLHRLCESYDGRDQNTLVVLAMAQKGFTLAAMNSVIHSLERRTVRIKDPEKAATADQKVKDLRRIRDGYCKGDGGDVVRSFQERANRHRDNPEGEHRRDARSGRLFASIMGNFNGFVETEKRQANLLRND